MLITSFAGVTINSIEKLSKDEAPTFVSIFNEVKTRAERRLSLEIKSRFNKRYKIANVKGSFDFGADYDSTAGKITTASAQYRGLLIDDQYFLPTTNQEVKRSSLMSYWIQSLTYYSPIVQVGSVIKIFDVALSSVLDTITFSAAIGWNTIAVNKSYDAWSVFIGVDSTAFNSVYKYVPSTTQRYPVNIRGGAMSIGANTSAISTGNNSFGLGGVFGVRCKFDSIICNNIDEFILPYGYLCVSELMQERLSSDRINKYTVDKKQAEELKAYYDDMFNTSIDQACDSINLDLNDECLECNEQITVREMNVAPNNSYTSIYE